MNHLIGKRVEVDANDMVYIGKLVEINETETHLQTDIGWIVVMNNQIAGIKEVEDD